MRSCNVKPNTFSSLEVCVHNQPVGTVVREGDKCIFNYHQATLYPEQSEQYLSLTMPLRQESYVSAHHRLLPIFTMHMPEGEVRTLLEKRYSKEINVYDDFNLLALLSPNIQGRISYADATPTQAISLDELLHPKSLELFAQLVETYLDRTLLGGVQPKVLASVTHKGTLTHTDYIVKSWSTDGAYPHLALNEYYCMKVAGYAGIPTPDFYLSDDYKLFIIKRFDKDEKTSTYLGMEDMCVLSVKGTHEKYDGSYEQIANHLRRVVASQYRSSSLRAYYQMMVLNNLVGNGDGHLKNYSVLYHDSTDVRISPVYDVVSTSVYDTTDTQALLLLGSKRWATKEKLIRFGMAHCELSTNDAHMLYDKCLHALERVKAEITEDLNNEQNQDVHEFLTKLIAQYKPR